MNDNIIVLDKLPEGFEVARQVWNYKVGKIPIEKLMEASEKKQPIDARVFYHCEFCEGWIKGLPYERHEDDLGPLCGRRGYVSECIRCGNEIGFSGMIS